MKGWVKGMLIGATVCVAVGSVMCVGAKAMGGRFSYYRHRNFGLALPWTEEEDILWDEDSEDMAVYEESAVISQAGSAGSSGQIENMAEGAPSGDASGRLAVEAKSGGTVVRALEIEVMGGWVEIVTDDSSEQIVVSSGNEDYQCRQELDKDKLEVYVGLHSGLWQDWLSGRDAGDFGDEKDLAARIVIPAGADFREVNLEVRGGGLRMSQVTAQKLNLELEAGVLEVSAGSVQKLESECKAGELIFRGQIGQEMEAECVTGTIQYVIEGKPEDFRYEVKATAGSIVIDGEEKGILNREKENVIDHGGASKKAKLECKAGAVDVEFQQSSGT